MAFTGELATAPAMPGTVELGVGGDAAPANRAVRLLVLKAGLAVSHFLGANARGASRALAAGLAVSHLLNAEAGTARPLPASRDISHNIAASEAMAVTSHVSMFRGEDVSLNFQMTPPVDITGWTLTFKCADKLGGTVQFTLTPSKPDAARGQFLVFIGHALTSSLAVGRYVWDVRRSDTNNVATLANGTLEIKQEVVP